jgi:uncharacterized protein YndB with AHSA1/START domain
MDGTVKQLKDGVELRFERDFAHPIEEVWAALTEPARLKDWLAEAEIDLRPGGRVHLKGDEIESTITAIESQKVIQYGWKSADWDGGQIRWELQPTDSGTHLTFTHVFTPMTADEAEEFRAKNELPPGWDPLPSTLAGWHSILDKLVNALGGRPEGPALNWRADNPAMQGWDELNEHYKKVLAR